MEKEYRPRLADSVIERTLSVMGAVLIQGPKGSGKTTTGLHFSESHILITDKKNPGILQAARDDPASVLKGPRPRLIDEWQFAPGIWDAVRNEVDDVCRPNQFILTGSAVPKDDDYLHSGTGRIRRVTLRTMSLFESGESVGTVSLTKLFEGESPGFQESGLDLDGVVEAMVRGGWPMPVINGIKGGEYAEAYVDGVVNSDVSRVDGVRRDPDSVRMLLRSLARNMSTLATVDTILGDVRGEGDEISDKTARSYMNALSRIFVIENLDSWNPYIRSKAAIRTSPKRMLSDPSIASAVLAYDAEGLMDDRLTLGLFFEALCVRDLRCYAQALNGTVHHYRDSYNLEVDCVVQLHDGRWGAIEVKLGESGIEKGASNLKKLRNRIDRGRMRDPSFLMILTASGVSYTRSDGIHVVPIGCLGP